jgi:DNA-binding transcriptional MerR regulator
MSEIQQLFQVSQETLDEWTSAGLLKPTRIGRQVYILFADLLPLFK